MNLEECRSYLAIDKHDLDSCLTQQPGVYGHVSDQHALAISRRDELKLFIEEATADLDNAIRRKAAKDEEKLTEGAITSRITNIPKMQELTRKLLAAKLEADRWDAVKKGFEQRSHALRDLVALRLGERRDIALESSPRNRVLDQASEAVRAATGQLRRERYATG